MDTMGLLKETLLLARNELQPNDNPPHFVAPHASSVFSAVLPLFGVSVLSLCFGRRTYNMPKLTEVPLARWLVLGIYADSWLFVFSSTVLNTAFGLRSSIVACNAGILLCLICYLTTKIIIYFFLVEKVYIIRSKHKGPRRRDKMYLFNTIGMLFPYFIVIILTFIFRISELHGDGECYIGLRLVANIPLLVFDIIINVYLTSLFLIPLFGVCSFDQASQRVRNMAKRTFWGSLATLMSTVANLTTLVVLRGHEPGWICFACCNADVVFSAIVLHWVTSTDYDTQPEEQTGVCFSCVELQNELNTELKKQGINPKARCKGFAGPGRHGGEVITEIASKPHNDSNYAVEGITIRVDHHRQVEDGFSSRDSRENECEGCCGSSDSDSVDAIRPKREEV